MLTEFLFIKDEKSAKERNGLFVQDVLGDLSSSEEDDDDDEETNKQCKKSTDDKNSSKSFKFNLDKNSIHVTSSKGRDKTGEESMSNDFEDSNAGFPNPSESESSNSKFGDKIRARQVNQTKNLDIFDTNSRNADEDTDNEVSLEATTIKKNKTAEDFNFSDLSSSLDSIDGKGNKSELNAKLGQLMGELQRIRDDRSKRENEIKNINNPVLKAHLTSRLNNLIEDENRKQSEIDEIRSELNE